LESSASNETSSFGCNFRIYLSNSFKSNSYDNLLILIIVITLGELFKRVFKNRILDFLVTTTVLIWIYGDIVKGKTVFEILISMVSLLAFFIAAFIVA